MKLDIKEVERLKKAFTSEAIGYTNNQTFNDSSHSQGNLQQTGTSQVWGEDEVISDEDELTIQELLREFNDFVLKKDQIKGD